MNLTQSDFLSFSKYENAYLPVRNFNLFYKQQNGRKIWREREKEREKTIANFNDAKKANEFLCGKSFADISL